MNVLLPILIMVGLGAVMNRRGRIQIDSLNQLTIYLLVPSFLFQQVSTSELTWHDIVEITWGQRPAGAASRRVVAPDLSVAEIPQ